MWKIFPLEPSTERFPHCYQNFLNHCLFPWANITGDHVGVKNWATSIFPLPLMTELTVKGKGRNVGNTSLYTLVLFTPYLNVISSLQHFLIVSFCSLPPCPLPWTVRSTTHFKLPHPSLSAFSSSPGCVWWTDVIISTSFMPLSSKQGDDCIYQALVCLRDAWGHVVLHSQAKQKRKALCVFDRQANW